MRILPLALGADHRDHVGCRIHAGIGFGRDIGPVRLDVGQMQAPRPAVGLGLADEVHRAPRHVGRLGMLVGHARGLVGVHQQPAVLQRAVVVGAGIGPVLPRVRRFESAAAQILVVFRARPSGRMQPVIALVRLEAAFGDMHADHRFRRDAERLHAFEVGRHVGLADQHVAHADLVQVIAQRGLADAQRPAVPVRAVRAHVAPGVERHPRRPADRRLHIGLAEQHATLRHGVDVRRLQCGMAGAAEIVVAKLVAHDPENVLRPRHASSLPFLDCSMLRY